MTMLLLPYVGTFSGQLHFLRSYISKVTTATEQLNSLEKLVHNNSYFVRLFFQSSYFFRVATFSGQLLFHSEISNAHLILENI